MKRQLMTLVCLLVSIVLTAATLTKDEARQKALLFLNERGANVAAARGMQQVKLQLKDGVVTDQLYVFNVGQKEGFVIVSGDDCTGDVVLGYADKGEIAAENMPVNLKAWLQGYADQIQWMQKHGVTNDVAASRAMKASAARKPVSPLLATEWNQYAPYNNNCPQRADWNGSAYELTRTVTGCVATAASQVMYFQANKYGLTSTTLKKEVPAYNLETCVIWDSENSAVTNTVAAKPVTTIDWSTMTDSYPSTDEANAAVAKLMEYVGAGVETQYDIASKGGSGASSWAVPDMLVGYFGYDPDIKIVSRDYMVYNDWLDVIYKELTTNGPVFISAQSLGGGHAFVLDGYSEADYFHVNWGWGGMSNGFYKMSVLNTAEQGAGGSASDDGYNFDQSVIVNVSAVDDGISQTDDIRLTVTKFESPTLSYVKYSSTDFGTINEGTLYLGVGVDYAYGNASGLTAGFDYGFALYQGSTLLKVMNSGTKENYINGASSWGTNYLTFGKDLADGEYKLVMVSRKAGTGTWLPCELSDKIYIKATVIGNNLTLENVGTNLQPVLSATLEKSGTAEVGQKLTMIAKISNSGNERFTGRVTLYGKEPGASDYSALSARTVDVEEGATDTPVEFFFTPDVAGDWSMLVKSEDMDGDDEEDALSSPVTVTVAAAEAGTTGTLTTTISGYGYDYDLVIENNVGVSYRYGFYGSKLQGHIKLTNTSATDDHTSGVAVMIWQYNGSNYSYVTRKIYATDIARNNGTQTIDFEFDGLTVGTSYLLTFNYADASYTQFAQSNSFSNQYGVTTYAADGTETMVAPTATVTVPADAVALDISHIDGVTTVTPNSNPNTLYIVGSSVPAGLEGKNVVKDGVAETLTLTDGYGFYSPVDFTATAATYTRTFTTGANGTDGWSTIVLPFDVDAVKQGSNVIDWFHSGSDTGKNFWLKTFSSEDGSTVYFDYADKLEANTPYIIAVPGDKWGAAWNLTGKAITFEGSNVDVTTGSSAISANNYKFVGTLGGESVTDSYVLNASGNAFAKTTATVEPFRAYFKSIKMAVGAVNQLSIGSEGGETTGIDSASLMNDEIEDGGVYNLKGQRVANPTKGLYIKSGKKVIIK